MNKDEWQTYLDRLFPSGVNVTAVSPSGMADDDYQFLSAQIRVRNMNGEIPTVSCFTVGGDRESLFTISDMVEVAPHTWRITQADPLERKYVLSRNFSAKVAAALREWRE